LKIVNDETGAIFPPEWEVKYIQDMAAYKNKMLKAREDNFRRLGIKS